MSAGPRKILVSTATGKQGGATIKALAAYNASLSSPAFSILAMVRSTKSEGALALAAIPNVEPVQGDLSDPAAVFAQPGAKDVYGLVSIQPSGDDEEKQGKALVDEAVKAGVKQVVYHSVNLGGVDDTHVSHFEAKRHIEDHIKTTYPSLILTVLRPVYFMDNLAGWNTEQGGFIVSVTLRGTFSKPETQTLQLVATTDIGKVAAKAFIDPEAYNGKTISLAGDDLKVGEIKDAFEQVMGVELPLAPAEQAKSSRSYLPAEFNAMFTFFDEHGYDADVSELRAIVPDALDFKTWLATELKQ